MIEYLDLVEDVLTNGEIRQGQKPEKALTVCGRQVRYDLNDGFPLLTTRDLTKTWQKVIIPELLWIMSGSTNANDLHKYGSNLWDKWAQASEEKIGTKNGELGPTYGHQMRNFGGKVDQLAQVIGMIKRDPNTRRAMISFWNLGDVEDLEGKHIVDVAPCISLLHFEQINGKLNLMITQRSADVPIGVPSDIAEYSLFLKLVAKEVGLKPGSLIHTTNDTHIYLNQIETMKELLKREPRKRPEVIIKDSPSGTIYDHSVEDFILENYNPHPRMTIPVEI